VNEKVQLTTITTNVNEITTWVFIYSILISLDLVVACGWLILSSIVQLKIQIILDSFAS